MKAFLFFLGFLFTMPAFGQIDDVYYGHTAKGDSLYQLKKYTDAASQYAAAFQHNSWKGLATDRYNAACCWALAGNADSAFFQLERIVFKMSYSNLAHISSDSDLNSLHGTKRWDELIAAVKANKEKLEANYIWPLVHQLDSIYAEDQGGRQRAQAIEQKYGWKSPQMDSLWKDLQYKDSVNLIKVMKILDEYGWLGADKVGSTGNSTLFLVIQHSDLAVQVKYLPMMREAVANGNAAGSQLALLEDRVLLRQGKKQIYGSQIGRNQKTEKYYVQPLEDPDNVDKRRASMGLQPLASYVSNWGMTWDPAQYKKDLPEIEEIDKANGQD